MRFKAYGTIRAAEELRSTPGIEVIQFRPDTEKHGQITLDVEPEAVVFLRWLASQQDSGVRSLKEGR